MVDRTKYPDDKVPDLALRQVFGRQRLPEDLCLLMANCKLLNVHESLSNARRLDRWSEDYVEDDRSG